jgi:hypothetical protein
MGEQPAPAADPVEIPAIVVSERKIARPQAPRDMPRLSIAHLLLWTTACALFFAAVKALAKVPPGGLGTVLVALDGFGVGAAWAGLCVFVSRRLRGAGWPIEPGEWLLALFGMRLAVETLLKLTMSGQFHSLPSVLDALTSCLAVVPVFSRVLPAPWKVVFYLLTGIYGLPLVHLCLEAWLHWPHGALGGLADQIVAGQTLLFGLVVLPAVWRDWRTGRRWSWLHWTGLALVWWLPLMEIAERLLT